MGKRLNKHLWQAFFWAILWRLIEALGLRRVEFFVRSLSYFGQILELFLEIYIFLSNSVKIEQKTTKITLFLPKNGKFVNKNDLKSVTSLKNSNFAM